MSLESVMQQDLTGKFNWRKFTITKLIFYEKYKKLYKCMVIILELFGGKC